MSTATYPDLDQFEGFIPMRFKECLIDRLEAVDSKLVRTVPTPDFTECATSQTHLNVPPNTL